MREKSSFSINYKHKEHSSALNIIIVHKFKTMTKKIIINVSLIRLPDNNHDEISAFNSQKRQLFLL